MDKLWRTLEENNVKAILNKINALAKAASKHSPLKILAHKDADGIASLVLLVEALNTKYITVGTQGRFRDYTLDGELADIVLDLGAPLQEDFSGIAIDHHDHFNWPGKYDLIWDNKPTTRIIYDLFRNRIPNESKWKAVVGICGDGQPALIPDEIWDTFGALLFLRIDTVEGKYYGKYTHWSAPLYKLLHSPINYIARTGDGYAAYRLLKQASSPLEIPFNPLALEAEQRIKDVMKLITSPKVPSDKLRLIHFSRIPVILCSINYEEAIGSLVAYNILNLYKNKTVIVVNRQTLAGSIRGDLAKYIANKLANEGFEAGGHPGFCGITLKDSDEYWKLLETLGKICS